MKLVDLNKKSESRFIAFGFLVFITWSIPISHPDYSDL